MLTVDQAIERILQHPGSWGDEILPLSQAGDRILAEPLVADRDFPPFTRVSMDGIAIDYAAFAAGRRQFRIAGTQAAGMPPLSLDDSETCLEVMTGAILPRQTDTVIRYEDLNISGGQALITIEDIRKGQNAHLQGADRKKGETITPAGVRIGAAELGIAASIGKAEISVRRMPKIALIATGDELVPVEAQPLPHQVRISNIYSLQRLLLAWGLHADLFHIPDERALIEEKLRSVLDQYDALALSGGVSAGKFDFVPEVLEELGVEKVFHKVQQRPGKPFWFGAAPGKTVFALPGNPVSSFMCVVRYFQPWLRASLGMAPPEPLYAALDEDFTFSPQLAYFLQVKVAGSPDGRLMAHPVAGKGSGDLANLAEADGFLELPADRNTFYQGEAYPLWLYRSL